ncbi:MAG: hypothetical protein KIT43_11210 [Bauldia sp.]|nr:hypothetical protein [Bauldia sp.]MCW5716422.1 hypothetical protein [Bauldia sp.]
MNRSFVIAVALAAAVFGRPAFAIDVHIGGPGDDDDVDVIVGTPEDAAANGDENPFANPNARINANGVPVGQTQLRATGTGCTIPADYVGLPCPPTAFTIVNAPDLVGDRVLTTDGIDIGIVAGAATTVDGETVFIVDILPAYMTEVDRIAVRLAFLYQSTQGLVVNTDAADLSSSIVAALAGAAAAAANGPAPIAPPAGITIPGPGAATPPPGP